MFKLENEYNNLKIRIKWLFRYNAFLQDRITSTLFIPKKNKIIIAKTRNVIHKLKNNKILKLKKNIIL